MKKLCGVQLSGVALCSLHGWFSKLFPQHTQSINLKRVTAWGRALCDVAAVWSETLRSGETALKRVTLLEVSLVWCDSGQRD